MEVRSTPRREFFIKKYSELCELRITMLRSFSICANFPPLRSKLPDRNYYLTTKDTKGSDIVISKVPNFVLFVTFVVKFVYSHFGCASAALAFAAIMPLL